ncbi:MAG: hypothetical protein LUE96_02490 [Lachnospiraceae bacterium]|nr:hypothetical protein [Lachnospiraceae bacterium]
MKNRDKWIAIVFLAFIIALPLATAVRNVLPQQEEQRSSEQQAILENNGTASDSDETQEDEAQEAQADASAETWFTSLQNAVTGFTEGLFGRTKLIAFNTELTSLLTGGTYIESTQVLLGKNNMFFYKTQLDGQPLWDYMGINHFTDAELEAITANMVATRAHLESMGIEFYAICVPNKEIVYEENMPDTIARVNEVSRGQQLTEYVNENTELVFIYPKDELIANKDDAQLYYLTDTHCNQKGSFVIMQALFEAVYGASAPLSSVSFRTDATDYVGDLAYIAGLGSTGKYKIDTVYSFEKESADESQYHDQVLLFVGDSFGGFLSTICKGYYKEVYWVYPDEFDYGMYEEYDPDVVIWERAERYCEKFGDSILITKY